MKRLLFFLTCLFIAIIVFAQQEKFDIVTFTPPKGWIRTESNGTLSFFDSKKAENGLYSFCQVILYPGNSSKTDAGSNFNAAWQNNVIAKTESKVKPITQTQQTPDGWTVITGTANVRKEGMSYKTILVNTTGFSKTISVQINTAGGDYAKILETFFENYNIDKSATPGSNAGAVNPGNSTVAMNDYEFIAPDKWTQRNNKDYLQFQNMQSGCLVYVFSPQSSSGNLEHDAKAVFETMYKGWQYQKSGERQYVLAKGFLQKGLEYCMMEATMSMTGADGRYNTEEGLAMVVKTNNQIVIISARHNDVMLGHGDCYRNYNTWRRFFNSFTIKNVAVPKNNEPIITQRIIGLWKINSVGVVLGDYVFAANGNYQFGGGIGSSTTTSDMYYKYIYNKAYTFEGDGSYGISGNLLTLKRRGAPPEPVQIRFEKVNYGGTGWKDRIWMLSKDKYGENEVVYDKKEK